MERNDDTNISQFLQYLSLQPGQPSQSSNPIFTKLLSFSSHCSFVRIILELWQLPYNCSPLFPLKCDGRVVVQYDQSRKLKMNRNLEINNPYHQFVIVMKYLDKNNSQNFNMGGFSISLLHSRPCWESIWFVIFQSEGSWYASMPGVVAVGQEINV